MPVKGYTRKFRPLELLSAEQVESIHRSTLQVLEDTGVRFESPTALDLFEGAGCRVDRDTHRVRFSPGFVEACVRSCPSSFTVRARDSRHDLRFGGNTVYFYNSVGMRTVDLKTWEPRVPTMQEQCDGVRVLDALENVHLVNSYSPYMEIEGVPPRMLLLESLASRLRNSTKTTIAGYSNGSEIFAIRMAKAAGTDVLGMVAASPPLTYYQDACEAAFRWVEAGFPIWLSSGGICGGTAPVTVAGATITNNAELMAGIALLQVIKRHTPVIVADFVMPMNMRDGHPVFGALGSALHAAAFSQIWRTYGIPTVESLSGYSSSKRSDQQIGYEKAILALPSALAGVNLVSMHGGLYGELTYHPVQSILDDDIAATIGRLIEGIDVSDDTLAVDVIGQVGPIPGMFIDKAHTRKWWKQEHLVPLVADRLTLPEWKANGKKGAWEYALQRLEEILSSHRATSLDADQDREIEGILEDGRAYYADRGML